MQARAAELEARLAGNKATAPELVELGRLYLQAEQPLKAAEMGFRARKLDREYAGSYNLLGAIYVAARQPGKAREMFTQAVKVAPRAVAPRQNLARFEISQGQGKAALMQLKVALRLDPTSGQTWMLTGEAQRLYHLDTSAGDSFQRALRLDPSLVEAYVQQGLWELDFDHYTNAIAPLEQAYGHGDRSPITLSGLALALLAGTGTPAATDRAETLLAELGSVELPAAWFARGLLALKRGHPAEGRDQFLKVLNANPRNERAQYALGDAYRALGDLENMRKALARHDQLVKERQRAQLQARQKPKRRG